MPDLVFLAQRRLDEARSTHTGNKVGIVLGFIIVTIMASAAICCQVQLNSYPPATPIRDVWGAAFGILLFIGLWPGGWFVCSACDFPRTKRDIRRRTWDLGDAFDGEEPTELYKRSENW